jgi:hypothetical protein
MIVTKSIALACSRRAAWQLLADGREWPRWAVRNILASKPLGENRWEIETTRGLGTLPDHGAEPNGILDHDFIDAQEGTWAVSARIVPVSTGSLFLMTLEKPAGMPNEVFEQGIKELDEELAQLARISSSF